ncbi:alpha/beta hydrolase [Streptomyces sp. ME19-01-6]|uniref:alpha/beta fold hydrolase n=1 Tax=Streptomyces sp. ME19-01-6 TaxID=3028686 RepID=UPI0029A6EE7F|nr:alpha/beta hydrolase [Streptomyces sp. ME19-01-6]MDX3225374.1 alpha/beta hydrolase [Streptomyces sp. ME19-01-6]
MRRADRPATPAMGPWTRTNWRNVIGDVNQPGVADAEFANDIPESFRRLLAGASGDNPLGREPRPLVVPDGLGLLDTMPQSPALPAWLTEEDIQAYAEDFALHGEQALTGAFNWYRNIERNNELLAALRGRGIDVPALYVVGDRDMVTSLRGPDGGSSLSEIFRGQGGPGNPLSAVAQLHGPVVLPGCGHWTQQERPAEVNAALGTSSPASTAHHPDDTAQHPPGRHRPTGAGPPARVEAATELHGFAFSDRLRAGTDTSTSPTEALARHRAERWHRRPRRPKQPKTVADHIPNFP